jgi:two-component system, chemotaxis family, CheB/CheR fusion protein
MNQYDQEFVYDNIRIEHEGQKLVLRIRISIFQERRDFPKLRLVIVEEKTSAKKNQVTEQHHPTDAGDQARVEELELELTYAKESLQATVEELETSNEELQASNEELLASNEELQSSNEELQSVNEELHTVNAENQSRISELMDLSNDISNLLAISRVSVMLVDADLRIRRMSTGMADILGLRDEDNGAPLEIVSRSINFPNVIMMAQKVIREKREEEIEITNAEKSSKLLIRMIPYRKETGRIHGLILTAIDLFKTRDVIESRNH